jgi:hypothetical protein
MAKKKAGEDRPASPQYQPEMPYAGRFAPERDTPPFVIPDWGKSAGNKASEEVSMKPQPPGELHAKSQDVHSPLHWMTVRSNDLIDDKLFGNIYRLATVWSADDSVRRSVVADELPEMGLRAKAAFLAGGGQADTARLFVSVLLHAMEHPSFSAYYRGVDEITVTTLFHAICEALLNLAPEATAAIPQLIEALDGGDYAVQATVAYVLGHFGPAAREAGPALIRLTRSDKPKVGHNAQHALHAIFDDFIESYNLNEVYEINKFLELVERYLGLSPTPHDSPLPPAPDSERQTPAAALKSLAATWPEDTAKRAAALAEAHYAYRQELANQLEPIINARIKQAIESGTSYDQKKEIVKSLNEELRLCGLAVACEVRNDAGILEAVHPGFLVARTARNEAGRIGVDYQEADGKYKRLGLTSDTASIKLMPVPSRHDHELEGPAAGTFAERLAVERSTQSSNRR